MRRLASIYILLLLTGFTVMLQLKTAKASDCWNPDGTHDDKYEFEEIGREEATCVNEGVIYLRCTGCQEYVKNQVINMRGHDFSVLLQKVEATEHKGGFSEYQCSRCNETIVKDTYYPKHLLLAKVDPEPTCTAQGRYLIYCVDCEYIEAYPIEAKGHTWRQKYSPSANCGHVEYRRFECEECHEVKLEEIPPTGNHVFQENIMEWPTCIKTGEKLITCQNCEYRESVVIPKSEEHLWSASWGSSVEHCYEIPVEYECTLCHKKKTEIIPPTTTEHFYQESSWKAANCTEDGEIRYDDFMCGLSYTEIIPAYGHEWILIDGQGPQCGREVVSRWMCSRCYEEKEEVTPATGEHSLSESITKKAICGVEGEKRVYCVNCDYSVVEKIPSPGSNHNWEVVISKPATCLEDGQTKERCTICGTEKNTPIPAVGHKWDEGVPEADNRVMFTCENDPSHIITTEGEQPIEMALLNPVEPDLVEETKTEIEEPPKEQINENASSIDVDVEDTKEQIVAVDKEKDSISSIDVNSVTEEATPTSKNTAPTLIIILLTGIPLAGFTVAAVKLGWIKKLIK